ncbi:MAG: hypothetical protein NZ843_04745 [Fimbriimonadales bacterium]|nr:hypothetical protein [Fimbriimonadales bacterium]
MYTNSVAWVRKAYTSQRAERLSLAVVLGLLVLFVSALAQSSLSYVFQSHGHGTGVVDIAYSPDGQYIATCAQDTTVKVWRVADGQMVYKLQRRDFHPGAVAISPDGQLLAAANLGKVYLWRTVDGTPVAVLTDAEFDELNRIRQLNGILFSPDGRYLAAFGGQAICLWRVADSQFPCCRLPVSWNRSCLV